MGQIGPDLSEIGVHAGTRRPDYSAPAYLRESILEPDAFIAPACPFGECPSGVMLQSFAAVLSDDDLDVIIGFLATLGTDIAPEADTAKHGGLSATLPVESTVTPFRERPAVASGPEVALGKALFFDSRLSGDRSRACASCHMPERTFSDGLALSQGYPETAYFRNTPTILNAALRRRLYWDGRMDASDLPTLVRDHMTEAHFMNVDGRLASERLKQVPAYVERFGDVYGSEPRFGGILNAIAAYLRTLVSGSSSYDAYLKGDSSALSVQALRGLAHFKAACVGCHSGELFTDEEFHDIGLAPASALLDEPLRAITFRRFFRTLGVPNFRNLEEDPGLYALTKDDSDRQRFRTPSLREVGRTAPYMHDGRFATLEEVVAFYAAGDARNGTRDVRFRSLNLSESDRADLVAFLQSLSSAPVEITVPEPPPYAVYAQPQPSATEQPLQRGPTTPVTVPATVEPLAPLPPPPAPLDNPTTPEKVELGRLLYFDPRMSGDGSLSCASCHPTTTGWGAPGALSFGYPGTVHWRNASTVLNVAYYSKLNWDGAKKSIEEQNKGAWTGAVAGNLDIIMGEERLAQIPEYVERFRAVFGTDLPRFGDALRAVAAYQRTLVSRGAPLDAYLEGQQDALGPKALRGLALFEGKAGCIGCHNGPLVSDEGFYALGVPMHPDFASNPLRQITFRYENWVKGADEETYRNAQEDYGLYYVTKQKSDMGKFRTPSLRDSCYTAPYMHNGVFATLADVVDFYNGGGGTNPNKDPRIKSLDLSEAEQDDLVTFLETLCGERIGDETPELPAYAAGTGRP